MDLLALTGELVDIASESFEEQELVEFLAQRLGDMEHLECTRVGDNLVARTSLGRRSRVVLGGHTDTVPANGNAAARIDGDTLWGVGSADMKGGLAVMLALAEAHREPPVDLTFVFYAREEVAARHSGLGELVDTRPDLLAGDVAVLGEPTGAAVEAGCQGSVRVRVHLRGERAHTARAWMGRNAIHRLGSLLTELDAYEPRQPEIQGCHFHEAMQAVAVDGGVAGNVVPDEVTLDVAHRFAPDRSTDEATEHLNELLSAHLDEADRVEVTDVAAAAMPALDHPFVAGILERSGSPARAKLGWTDVARFAEIGIPAINFGPGDPTLAHTREEHLVRASIETAHAVLDGAIRSGF
ncbi:MAG: succinyl-diaminopimelate desuccinylase [Microthrixaceae bacterium]|nr:succinyl-diaminopimelate desuccinylase [Microthrixaceae bacterium]